MLTDILEAKRRRLRTLSVDRPWSTLTREPLWSEPRRSLAAALRRVEGPVRFLAEIKRASPSAGEIRPGAEATEIAVAFREAGAGGISLVTEEDFFLGRPEDLPRVRSAGLPVLMKDFLIDPYQVALARALGADAVLLIVAVGDRVLLREARDAARELELEALVEVHSESEVEEALRLDCALIGINNRDLDSFKVDLGTSERLLPRLPAGAVRLAESGIASRQDVLRLERCGFDALLVGESLMRAQDPGLALRRLRGAVPSDGTQPRLDGAGT